MEENNLEINQQNNTETNNSSTLNILGGKTDDKPPKKKEFFTGITSGEIPTDIKSQLEILKNDDVSLGSMTDLWKDESIKKKYKESFGNDAFDKFNQDYNATLKMYNTYAFAKTDVDSKNAILKAADDAQKLGAGQVKSMGVIVGGINPELKVMMEIEGGRRELLDITTEAKRSTRNDATDNSGFFNTATGTWEELEPTTGFLSKMKADAYKLKNSFLGNIFDFKGLEETADRINPIYNPKYVDEKGNQIKMLTYVTGDELKKEMERINPGSQHGDFARGKAYYKSVYEGEEIGDQEVVSTLDFYNITDPQLKAGLGTSLLSAIPRAAVGTVTGIVGGAVNTMISLNDFFDSGYDSDFRRVLEKFDATLKSSKISISEESKEDAWTGENISTNTANIVAQIFTAAVSGGAAIPLLTSMAVESSRDEAIAAGFSKEEAAFFQLASIAAMGFANKTFSWVDKKVALGKLKSDLSKKFKADMGYVAPELAKQTTEEGRKEVVKKAADKWYISVKNSISNAYRKAETGAEKIGLGGALNEASEEMFENTLDKITKGLNNTLFINEEEEKAGKGFISTNDPQYWNQYWSEMGMAGFFGGVGGVIGDVGLKLFNKGRSKISQDHVTGVILNGLGPEYLQLLTQIKSQKNGLGSDDLSIEFDEATQSYKPVGEGRISHNEANYRLLLNEYNALYKVIGSIGSQKAIDMIKTDPDFKDSKLAGEAIQDVRNLTSEYLGIISENPTLKDAALDLNRKFESEKARNENFEGLSKTYNVSVEKIKRLQEIKQELNSINNGEKTEEYIFNTLVDIDTPEKYNKDFKKNLFRALRNDKERREKEAKDLEDLMQETGKKVNELKDDLSNLDILYDSTIISSSDREKIINKISNATLPEEDKKYLIEYITKNFIELNENGEFNNKRLSEQIEILSRILTSNEIKKQNKVLSDEEINQIKNDFKKRLINITSQYYKQKINDINKHSDLFTLNSENKAKEFKLLNFLGNSIKNAEGNIEFDVSEIETILEENPDDNDIVDLLLNEKETLLANNSESLFAIQDKKFEQILNNTLNKLNKIVSVVNNAQNENVINKLKTSFDFLYNEIYGSGSNVNLGATLKPRIKGDSSIHKEFENSVFNNIQMFNNVSETQELLEQLKIKKQLVEGIMRYHSTLSSYRSSFDRLMKTLNLNKKRNLQEIIDALQKETVDKKFTAIFNDLFFDPIRLRLLDDKYKDVISKYNTIKGYEQGVEKINKEIEITKNRIKELQTEKTANLDKETIKQNNEELNELKEKLIKLENDYKNIASDEVKEYIDLLSTYNRLNYILTDLEENIEKLEGYLKVAKNNENVENQKSNRINGIANGIKENIKKVYDFIDSSSSMDANNINRNIPEVKEFLDYYNTKFRDSVKNEAALKEDNIALYKFYAFLRNQDNKLIVENSLKNYFFITFPLGKAPENNAAFNRLLIASKLNIEEFDKRFDEIAKKSPYLSYAEQQEVALTAAAHVSTDVSNFYYKLITERYKNEIKIKSENVMTLFGSAGTGKSTFGIGIGVSIGLDLVGSNNKVYLASNVDTQVNTLNSTAKNFNFQDKVFDAGDTTHLLNFLQDVLDNKADATNFKILVFDEATIPSSLVRDPNAQNNTEYTINKILYLIEEINKTKTEENKIKVILSGDPEQNGYVKVENETDKIIFKTNIGQDKTYYFGSQYLTLNLRSKVKAIAAIANEMKTTDYKMNKTFGNSTYNNNFISTYGDYVDSLGKITKLGVQFATDNDNMFNNEEFINHLKEKMDNNKDFVIGVVGNDFDYKLKKITEKGDSKLDALMLDEKYAKHFKFFTHELVQGETFDYTICTIDSPTFFDSRDIWSIYNIEQGEKYVANKLATTIERSKYFTLAINRTKRVFSSELSNTFTLASETDDKLIVEDVKKFLLNIRTYNTNATSNAPSDSSTKADPITDVKDNTKTTPTDWNSLINNAVSEKELNAIIDQATKENVNLDFTIINKKRATFVPTTTNAKDDIEKTLYGTLSGSRPLSEMIKDGIYIDLGNNMFAYVGKEGIAVIVNKDVIDNNGNYRATKSFWVTKEKRWDIPNLANLKDDAKIYKLDEQAYIDKFRKATDKLNAELDALEGKPAEAIQTYENFVQIINNASYNELITIDEQVALDNILTSELKSELFRLLRAREIYLFDNRETITDSEYLAYKNNNILNEDTIRFLAKKLFLNPENITEKEKEIIESKLGEDIKNEFKRIANNDLINKINNANDVNKLEEIIKDFKNDLNDDLKDLIIKKKADLLLNNKITEDNKIQLLKLLLERKNVPFNQEERDLINQNTDFVNEIIDFLKSSKTIEEIQEILKEQVVIPAIESDVQNLSDQDLNDIAIAEQYDTLTLEENDEAVDGAKQFQEAMYKAGLVSSTNLKDEPIENTKEFLSEIFKSNYQRFEYEFEVVPFIDPKTNQKFYNAFINVYKDGQLFSKVKIFVPENDANFISYLSNIKEKLILSPKQIEKIINYVTSGKVNGTKQNPIKLSNLRKTLTEQGFTVSEDIFVFTKKSGDNNAGDAFILFSQNPNANFTDIHQKPQDSISLTFELNINGENKTVRRFKNGIGAIKLNLKPKSIKELFQDYLKIIQINDGKRLPANKFIDTYTHNLTAAKRNIEFLTWFLDKFTGENNFTDIYENATQERLNQFEKEYEKFINNLNKQNYTEDELRQLVTKLYNLSLNSLSSEGNDNKVLFFYNLNKEKKRKAQLNFNILFNNLNEKEIDVLSSIYEIGFKKGIYAKFKAFKTYKNKNQLFFAPLDTVAYKTVFNEEDLDNSYEVNVNPDNPVKLPLVYLNLNTLQKELDSSKTKKDKKITAATKPAVVKVKSKIDSKDLDKEKKANILIEQINNAQDPIISDIDELIATINNKKLQEDLTKKKNNKINEKNKVVNPTTQKPLLQVVNNKSDNLIVKDNLEDEDDDNKYVEINNTNYNLTNNNDQKVNELLNALLNYKYSDSISKLLLNVKRHISLSPEIVEKLNFLLKNPFSTINNNKNNILNVLSNDLEKSILNDKNKRENYILALQRKDPSLINEKIFQDNNERNIIKNYLENIFTCN